MIANLARQNLQAGPYRLTPLTLNDAAGLLALFGDPAVAEFMDIAPLAEVSEAHEIIAWAQELAGQNRGLRWAIRREGDDTLIGTIGFNALELERGRRGEIAYDLARSEWGRGVMRQIMPYVIGFGFERLGLRRLEAMVTLGNTRSSNLLERNGFLLEGTLRDHAFWKGRFWDQLIYGRLAD